MHGMAARQLSEDGEVHIWRACLDLEKPAVGALEDLLAPDERARACRFHYQSHCRRFIAARAMLRRILAYYLAMHPSDVEITYGPYGKPRLGPSCSECEVNFSVSHSEGVALYGVTTKRQIGVDIEQVRPVPELEAIARGLFCPSERAILQRLASHERLERFFRLWTQKEAYLKARGCGFAGAVEPSDVRVERDLTADGRSTAELRGQTTPWSFLHLKPINNCIAAIAVEGAVRRTAGFQWQDSKPIVSGDDGDMVWHRVPVE